MKRTGSLRFGIMALALLGAQVTDALINNARADAGPSAEYIALSNRILMSFFPTYDTDTRNDATFIVNGHTVRIVTNASSFVAEVPSGWGTYNIYTYVDGVKIGTGNSLTNSIANLQYLLLLLNTTADTEKKAVATDSLRSQTQQVTGLIARRISQVLVPRPSTFRKKDTNKADAGGIKATYADGITGVSSGDELSQFGLWATGSYS